MYRTLLIDHDATHAEQLMKYLRERHLGVTLCRSAEETSRLINQSPETFDVMIAHVRGPSEPWLKLLREANDKAPATRGRLRLFSLLIFPHAPVPAVRLRFERLGARYVCQR
jgi:DNA-binding NtrC family response regulator